MRLSFIGALVGMAIAGHATATSNAPGAAAPDAAQRVPSATPSAIPPRHRPAPVEHYVDLNSATRSELMTLPGVGKTEAERIIANRPYLVKTDLVSKNVLAVGPFLSIKRFVVAMPKSVTQAKH